MSGPGPREEDRDTPAPPNATSRVTNPAVIAQLDAIRSRKRGRAPWEYQRHKGETVQQARARLWLDDRIGRWAA